jgi:hypothetical protein
MIKFIKQLFNVIACGILLLVMLFVMVALYPLLENDTNFYE